MSNPYQTPTQSAANRDLLAEVQRPAIALIIVALVAIILGTLGLVLDVFLLASGAVANLEATNAGPTSEYTPIAVRSIWGAVLVIASSFVLYGAIKMKNLESHSTARAAAIVAMIPLLGPCFVLGIPFGIWAWVVLGKPDVKNAFAIASS